MMIKTMNKPAARIPILRRSLITKPYSARRSSSVTTLVGLASNCRDVFAFQGAFVLTPFELSGLQGAAAARRLLDSDGGLVGRGRLGRARRSGIGAAFIDDALARLLQHGL